MKWHGGADSAWLNDYSNSLGADGGFSVSAKRIEETPFFDEKSNLLFEEKSKNFKEANKIELDVAEIFDKINHLEKKIKNLESRTVKTYPDVKFLNYKDRKRILVSILLLC